MIETHSETDRPMRGTEAPAAATVPRRRRPFGVKAIVALLLLSFVASVIAGIVLPYAWSVIPADLQFIAAFDIVIAVVLGLVSVIVAIGLLQLKRWAWYGVMLLTGLRLLLAIWQYVRGGQPYIDLLLNSLIAFYLNQRDVQGLFSAAPATERAP